MTRKTKLARMMMMVNLDEAARFNALLWKSQRRLTREIGTDAVNELIISFVDEARQNPALLDALYMQDDPYRWAYERMRRLH